MQTELNNNDARLSDFRNVFVKSNKDYFKSVIYGKNKESNINEEYNFAGGIIVSSTDLNGIITYANRKFCEISGYDKDELIGSNHNIIRHPDMPHEIFKQAWDVLMEGKEWSGVIKNLRKDGKFYWVYSHIMPIMKNGQPIGYSAARRPPMESELNEAKELYRDMIAKEINI
ncbi:MAG: PAS domain-containing protein [Sulfurovaceae bacterium]|nr:PAS domain-containing protein [Sulfurovaceae bacterium]